MTTGDIRPWWNWCPPYDPTSTGAESVYTTQRPKKITERFDKDGNLIERITEDLNFDD
jgi:hypothetical protein